MCVDIVCDMRLIHLIFVSRILSAASGKVVIIEQLLPRTELTEKGQKVTQPMG